MLLHTSSSLQTICIASGICNRILRHLHEKGFPQSVIKQYAHDIFGFTDKEGYYHEGLVDSFDASEFDVHVGELKDEWNQREVDCLL